jgi:FKBP-type peptidyl-prolyl cis-trans isomerase
MNPALAFAVLLSLAAAAPARAQGGGNATPATPSAPPAAAPANAQDALYALGLAVATSLEPFMLSPAEFETVMRGMREGWSGKSKVQLDAKAQALVNDLARDRAPKAAERAAQREKEAGAAALAKAAKEPGAKKTASGAIVIPVKEGTGAKPAATDKVKVHYTGTLVSGRVFDTSAQRGPAEFPLSGVIKCWTEGLQQVKVGGKAKLVCPSDIAYGPNGNPPVIPGNAVLTFEVELLDIVK